MERGGRRGSHVSVTGSHHDERTPLGPRVSMGTHYGTDPNVTFDHEVVETEIDPMDFPPEAGLILESLPPANEDRELLVLALATAPLVRGVDEAVMESLIHTATETGIIPEPEHEEYEEEGQGARASTDRLSRLAAPESHLRASTDYHARDRAPSEPHHITDMGGFTAHPEAEKDTLYDEQDDDQRKSALERLEAMIQDPDFQAALGWASEAVETDYEGAHTDAEEGEEGEGEREGGGGSARASVSTRGSMHHQVSRRSSKAFSRQSSRRSSVTGRSRGNSRVLRSRQYSGTFSVGTEKGEERSLEEPVPYRMSAFFGFFNLVNDVATSSIVSVPYFVIVSGLPTGLMMLLFMSILGHLMLLLLHRLTLERNLMSFVETCFLALGLPGYLFSTAAIFVFNFGGFVSGLIMIAGMVPGILTYMFGEHTLFERSYVLTAAMVLLSPLAFKKHLASLNFVSATSVSIAIFLVFGVIIHAVLFMMGALSPTHTRPDPAGSTEFFRPEGSIKGLGGLGYLYACHDLAYHISTTLEKNTMRRYAVVSGLSMYIPMLMLAAMSVCAWLVFGDNTEANILDSYGQNDTFAFILRLLLSLNVVCNVPYTIYMPRIAILSLIQLRFPQYVLPMPTHHFARNVVHVVVTLFLLVIGWWIADTVTDLGAVFGLVGGVSGIAISTILPAACWLQLGPKVKYMDGVLRMSLWGVLLFGVATMVVTCVGAFM